MKKEIENDLIPIYHFTSKDNFESIKKDGLKSKKKRERCIVFERYRLL